MQMHHDFFFQSNDGSCHRIKTKEDFRKVTTRCKYESLYVVSRMHCHVMKSFKDYNFREAEIHFNGIWIVNNNAFIDWNDFPVGAHW